MSSKQPEIPSEFVCREAFDAYFNRRHHHSLRYPARLFIELAHPARAGDRVQVKLLSCGDLFDDAGCFRQAAAKEERGPAVLLFDEELGGEGAEGLNTILRTTRRLSGLDHIEGMAFITQYYLLVSDYFNYAWGNYFSLLALPTGDEIAAAGPQAEQEWEEWLAKPVFQLKLLFKAWPDMVGVISSRTGWEKGPGGRPMGISWQFIPPVWYEPDEDEEKRGLKIPVMVNPRMLPVFDNLPRVFERLKPIAELIEPGRELAGKSLPLVRFPVPPGTRWEDIRISIVSKDSLRISVKGGDSRRLMFSDIGFKDGRKGDLPDVTWEFFKELARRGGEMTGWPPATTRTVQKRVQAVRRKLKAVTGLVEDPFHPYWKVKGYIARFRFDCDR